MTSPLSGRVAIVTGANGGLGSALCSTLGEHGADVLPVDVVGDTCFIADVGTSVGNESMVKEAIKRFGRVDILALNAGAQFMSPIAEFPETEWDRLMGVMAKGPYLAIRHAWPHIARAGGRVVVTASASSFTAEAYKSAYVAAKHAVIGLVRTVALEGGPLGMTANAVAPAWMRTPMVENQVADQMRLHNLSREAVLDDFLARMPVKRFVEPREVAETVAFLASDAASAINGAVVPVDLGMLAS
jgi:3-hydroxybutyrate dehydrogenase